MSDIMREESYPYLMFKATNSEFYRTFNKSK